MAVFARRCFLKFAIQCRNFTNPEAPAMAHQGTMTRKPQRKDIIGGPLVINGRQLSLSKAVRAGDFMFLTGQVPMVDGRVLTTGSIEDQTRAVLDRITETLAEAGCSRDDVVKTMVWLKDRADFPGFNAVYGDYFPTDPPARSALVSDFLVDIRVEVEVIAWKPQ
jgi:2-iminobutanoate/2-iminopropanoate deaminase